MLVIQHESTRETEDLFFCQAIERNLGMVTVLVTLRGKGEWHSISWRVGYNGRKDVNQDLSAKGNEEWGVKTEKGGAVTETEDFFLCQEIVERLKEFEVDFS